MALIGVFWTPSMLLQILVDCYGGRRRRYWCAARDSLVKAIEDNLRKLGRTSEAPLNVERVGSWEVRMLGWPALDAVGRARYAVVEVDIGHV